MLLPCILYSEHIFKEALLNGKVGIVLKEELLRNIRYVDATVFADSTLGLQKLMDNVTKSCRQYALDINVNKTKLMVISKNYSINCQLDG